MPDKKRDFMNVSEADEQPYQAYQANPTYHALLEQTSWVHRSCI